MSALLRITQAKPNPLGKDKTPSGSARPEQLLGEWVDIENVGNEAVTFSKIQLSHTLFDNRCNSTGRTETYWTGSGTDALRPGQVIRIHTGRSADSSLMLPADRGSVAWHGYANRSNFVLNNRCGDTIAVTWRDAYGGSSQDQVSYDPNPPEGAVLTRVGNRLVSLAVSGRR